MRTQASVIIAAFISIIGFVVFLSVLERALWSYQNDKETDNTTQNSDISPNSNASGFVEISPKPLSRQNPQRLIIPALNISANIQHVGVAKSGNMAVPNNYTDVGWYRYGPTPGEAGSAVMDGHVDNGLALAGVFKHLSDVKVGDDIYVDTEAGKRIRFVVSAVNIYDYKNVPVKDIFSTDGVPRLSLITCNGAWIQSERTYNERIVVTAILFRES